MDISKIMVGLIIKKIVEVHDYLQINFFNGMTLNIYNKYLYDYGPISSIEGKEIRSVVEADNEVVFRFRDCSALIVGLQNEDYNGPEAMELKRKDEPPIVWQ